MANVLHPAVAAAAAARPKLSIQVSTSENDDQDSPGPGPHRHHSPRRGAAVRHTPYHGRDSGAGGSNETPGLSTHLADFSLLTPTDGPVSARTRRMQSGSDFKDSNAEAVARVKLARRASVGAPALRTGVVASNPPQRKSRSAPAALHGGASSTAPPSQLPPLGARPAEPGTLPSTLPSPPHRKAPSFGIRSAIDAPAPASGVPGTLAGSALRAAGLSAVPTAHAAAAHAAAAAASKAPQAEPVKPPGALKRRSSSTEPLAELGYAIRGPIASGAFSKIVRAQHLGSGVEVAVKSFALKPRATTSGQLSMERARATNGGKAPKQAPKLAAPGAGARGPVGGGAAAAAALGAAAGAAAAGGGGGGGAAPGFSTEAADSEVVVLRALQQTPHPGLCNMVASYEARGVTYALLEYCGGGSLRRQLQALQRKNLGFSEAEARPLLRQIGSALAHIHRRGVVHRDVKPDNLLYTDAKRAQLKLCDFGFAALCKGGGRLKTICGTPLYMAPELSRTGLYSGQPVDVWAFGCIVYEAVHNKPCFRAETMQQLQLRIKRASHEPLRKDLSPSFRALLQLCLTPDSAARATADVAHEHAWLDDND